MEFDTFTISFESLKLGKHDYKFLVDTTFFSGLEYSEIQEGKVIIDGQLIKSARLMELNLDFKGEVVLPCDLCGENYTQTISFKESVVIKFGDEQDQDEGMIILKRGESEVNMSHYIYESIILSLPIRRVHPEVKGKPSCDEAILAKLNDKGNQNDDDIDPRWSALKKLK